MRDNLLKKIIKLYYRPDSKHYILVGPMKGMVFRVNNVTQLTPLYSGDERWHQKRFKELMCEGKTVIDVGANWGLHTLYSSRLVGKKGKVIAIEPLPVAFNELKWHVKENSCENVVLLNIALGESNGEIKILSEKDTGQGIVSDFVNDNSCVMNENIVIQKKLDTIVQELELNKIDLIKVDVEGAEKNVVMGGEETVGQFRPYFIIDPHDPKNDVFLGKWFTERGYKLERVNKTLPAITRTDKGWPDREGVWSALLAIP